MKIKIFLSIITCVLYLTAFTQEKKSEEESKQEQTESAKKDSTDAEKKLEEISKKISVLLDESESESIGRFVLTNFSPSIYSKRDFSIQEIRLKADVKAYKKYLKSIKKGKPGNYTMPDVKLFKPLKEVIKIDSIEFNISEGVIQNIRITAGDRIFENHHPIPLVGFDVFSKKIFVIDIKDDDRFLVLNDFTRYLPKPGRNYNPEDEEYVLSESNKQVFPKASLDLNSNIDFKIFTDFLGLFNKAGNGLVQAEGSSKIYYNNVPVGNDFYIFNYMEPSVRYSKFDSKYSAVKLSARAFPYITSQELLQFNQYSYLNLGFKLNIFRQKVFEHFAELNGGISYDFVDVVQEPDSVGKTANMRNFYLEVAGGIIHKRNFGLIYSVQSRWQRVQNTGLKIPTGEEVYLVPSFTAFYYPNGKPKDKIFFRFTVFTNSTSGGSFTTVQVGYNTKIGFKGKK